MNKDGDAYWNEIELSDEATLIGRIQTGELKWWEVEKERKRSGLPVLAGWADPAAFNPMAMVHWTPTMVVAWIIWRTAEAVRQEILEYRAKSTYWHSNGEGTLDSPTRWTVEPKAPHSIEMIIAAAHILERPEIIKPEHCKGELLRALQERRGGLAATGRLGSGARRMLIPSDAWEDLRSFEFENTNDAVGEISMDKPTWFSVRIERDTVLKLWPESKRQNAKTQITKAKQENDCKLKLIEIMTASPERPQPKSKIKLELFPEIADRAFDRAWGDAASAASAPAWSSGGRRKSPHP